jgi:hypothetical protein
MNSLAALLEQFSLPELTRVLRRTALVALAAAAAALLASAFLGAAIFGWGMVAGLVLGLVNIRLVSTQTAHVSAAKIAKPLRSLASLTLVRLAATTAIVIGLAVAVTSLGLGAVAGIAVFYLIFLFNLILGVLRHRGATD